MSYVNSGHTWGWRMAYNIHYDVAAAFLMGILLIYFYCKKSIRTMSTNIFAALLWLSFGSDLLDGVTVYAYAQPFPVAAEYALNMLYLLSFNLIPVVYNLYLLSLVKDKKEWTAWNRVLLFVPYFISAVLILGTPWTGLIFTYDDVNGYQHGRIFSFLYGVSGYYMIFSWYMIIHYRKKLVRAQRAVVWVYTALCLGGILVQANMSHVLILQFCVSVSILLAYLSLENPDDDMEALLGIYNRKGFIKMMKKTMEKNKSFEVEIFNIDNYRLVRDILGVEKSSAVMKQAVEALDKKIPHVNLFCLNEGQLVAFTENMAGIDNVSIDWIRLELQKTVTLDDVDITLSVSNFELLYPRDVSRMAEIVDIIDYSLNFVVDEELEGRRLASEKILENRKRENKITHILQRAIANEEFEIYYQPIYSVKDRCFNSAEALIRLHDEELGFISPEDFIPLAEKNGMIFRIGEFVFRSVCKAISEKKLEQYGLEYIEVNLSVAQCMQENLHKTLLAIMDEYHVPHSFINLEITETAVTVSKETLRNNIEFLRKKGVTFSMDDYGTGYSNITNVITYPFHIVKMDKSIVWYAMENDRALSTLKHSINMIKSLNMDIVAEGVETKEQSQALQEMGCDYLQGYYYSKPIPLEAFIAFISENS